MHEVSQSLISNLCSPFQNSDSIFSIVQPNALALNVERRFVLFGSLYP